MNINDLGIHPHKLHSSSLPVNIHILSTVKIFPRLIRGVCRVTKRSQRKCTNMQTQKICLYKLYSSKCSTDRHTNAFYFTPLARSSVVFQSSSWSQRAWKCHQWCAEAGWIEGHYTNTPIIPLEFPWPVPGFLMHKRIMSRTGHSSTDGVRPYKRASNKLKKVTSDVLNRSAQPATKTVESEQEKRSKDEAIKPASQAEPPLKRPCF